MLLSGSGSSYLHSGLLCTFLLWARSSGYTYGHTITTGFLFVFI